MNGVIVKSVENIGDSMKKIEITQKKLNKMLGEARQEGWEIGKKSAYFPLNKERAKKMYDFICALYTLLDDRYEPYHETY